MDSLRQHQQLDYQQRFQAQELRNRQMLDQSRAQGSRSPGYVPPTWRPTYSPRAIPDINRSPVSSGRPSEPPSSSPTKTFNQIPVGTAFHFTSDPSRTYLWVKFSTTEARNQRNGNSAGITGNVAVIPELQSDPER
jgi:hypothetical protein